MEQYTMLNVTLTELFRQNSLKNWSIFDDVINGSTIVKLRFTKSSDCEIDTTPQHFRRKSDSQVARDRDRAARHQTRGVMTRSRAAAAEKVPSAEILRRDSSSETVRSLESCSSVQLNPLAANFSPQPSGLESVDRGSNNIANISISSIESQEVEMPVVNDADAQELHNGEQNDEILNSSNEVLAETIQSDNLSRNTACVKTKPKYISKDKKFQCKNCHNRFTGGTADYNIKVYYCWKCKITICGLCYPKSKHYFQCRNRVKMINS